MNKTFFDKPTLHTREERKLKALAKRKLIKAWVLTVLWYAAVIAGWAATVFYMRRPVTHPGSFIFMLMLVLPFYPLKAHTVLFGKTFYANVCDVRFGTVTKAAGGFLTIKQAKNLEREALFVTFNGDKGERKTVIYKEENIMMSGGYYKIGDRVLVLQGLKYPVKVPLPEDGKMLCPVCGMFTKEGKRKCGWCNADFQSG